MAACEPTMEATPASQGRDLSMLYAMIELNAAHRGMEPFLRDRSRFEELATTADGMAAQAASERLAGFPDQPEFTRDPEPWRRFRSTLERSATELAAAARAGDAEGVHRAYSNMDGSCIACHKRYLETH